MKKRWYGIPAVLLWVCFLAAAAGIFLWVKQNTEPAGPGETSALYPSESPETASEENPEELFGDLQEHFEEPSGDLQEHSEKHPEEYPYPGPGMPENIPEKGIWLTKKTEKGRLVRLRIMAGKPLGSEGKPADGGGKRAGGKGKYGGREMPGGEGTPSEREPGLPSEILPEPSRVEKERPPVIYVASDLHYQSALTTDYGKAYEKFVAESDGKAVTYLPQILDAFIDEMIEAKPDAFLLTGDITMNGERVNHEELAEKLRRLSDAGIPVLVIPGNHDINNYRGRVYFGDKESEAEIVSPEEFAEIYRDFGPGQAVSRDEVSFSYIYPLREKLWLMLLDTAQYEPLNIVDGAVRQETLEWMEENLERAKAEGIQVIVSGHHNLLQESRLFTTMCVLENSDEVISLLEEYGIPLYISGHLHLQRIQKHRREPGADEYGIYEIVSDALSIPPCQYGIFSWDEAGSFSYETRQVQVGAWAEKTGQCDENLLHFDQYQREYVRDLIKVQILGKTFTLPEKAAEEMAALYAEVYADYCGGLRIGRREIEQTDGYRSWQRYLPDSREFQELKAMVKDSMGENNVWESER